MQISDYKLIFDRIDAEPLKISPRRDIMLLRVIAAVIPVVFFGLDALYGLPARTGWACRFTCSAWRSIWKAF